jgi:hypothetical protein
LGSLQVLRNRLDAHILPRWADKMPAEINYLALLDFTQFLSGRFSSCHRPAYRIHSMIGI